jgi:hypothetical protein
MPQVQYDDICVRSRNRLQYSFHTCAIICLMIHNVHVHTANVCIRLLCIIACAFFSTIILAYVNRTKTVAVHVHTPHHNLGADSNECIQLLLQLGNLVDPASSHMLVSKIKPCMCMYIFLNCETANCSLIQLFITWPRETTWITTVIL